MDTLLELPRRWIADSSGEMRVEKMRLRDVIADGMIVGLSASLLWHFSNIWRGGQYLIGEPNVVIRSLETAGLLIILVFGISKYISDLRREIRRRDKDRKQ